LRRLQGRLRRARLMRRRRHRALRRRRALLRLWALLLLLLLRRRAAPFALFGLVRILRRLRQEHVRVAGLRGHVNGAQQDESGNEGGRQHQRFAVDHCASLCEPKPAASVFIPTESRAACTLRNGNRFLWREHGGACAHAAFVAAIMP
jgi:hypothetical protein